MTGLKMWAYVFLILGMIGPIIGATTNERLVFIVIGSLLWGMIECTQAIIKSIEE